MRTKQCLSYTVSADIFAFHGRHVSVGFNLKYAAVDVFNGNHDLRHFSTI